ncbi:MULTISPECIES: hypothetical protein [unclassified Cryobacterium]|uniref:hypothetical protein n=1 Tax=Cryobacterium sp. BB307 TaxID=2716317 RepID=UPI001FF0DEC2|nr:MULTISPECIES: hypothetical protein [unclassified Cryobacterium]
MAEPHWSHRVSSTAAPSDGGGAGVVRGRATIGRGGGATVVFTALPHSPQNSAPVGSSVEQ